jgi:hypothetical protein
MPHQRHAMLAPLGSRSPADLRRRQIEIAEKILAKL